MQLETAIDGFQGGPGQLSDTDRVLATAKHFAGDGAQEPINVGDASYDPLYPYGYGLTTR